MAKKQPKNYVNNATFHEAMKEYKAKVKEAEDQGDEAPRIPDYIGTCLYQIATRLSYRPNFINYSYREEMISDGLENAIMAINSFDPDKGSNPFAYFTQIIYFAFIRRIHKEKKQTYIKHKVLENSVLTNQAFESSGNDDRDANVDIANDYMNDFVEKYEDTMLKNKKKVIKKKKGLENFIDDDEEES